MFNPMPLIATIVVFLFSSVALFSKKQNWKRLSIMALAVIVAMRELSIGSVQRSWSADLPEYLDLTSFIVYACLLLIILLVRSGVKGLDTNLKRRGEDNKEDSFAADGPRISRD